MWLGPCSSSGRGAVFPLSRGDRHDQVHQDTPALGLAPRNAGPGPRVPRPRVRAGPGPAEARQARPGRARRYGGSQGRRAPARHHHRRAECPAGGPGQAARPRRRGQPRLHHHQRDGRAAAGGPDPEPGEGQGCRRHLVRRRRSGLRHLEQRHGHRSGGGLQPPEHSRPGGRRLGCHEVLQEGRRQRDHGRRRRREEQRPDDELRDDRLHAGERCRFRTRPDPLRGPVRERREPDSLRLDDHVCLGQILSVGHRPDGGDAPDASHAGRVARSRDLRLDDHLGSRGPV